MSHISFSFTVQGTGSTELPVEILDPVPLSLTGLASATLGFRVTNPTSQEVVLPDITLSKEGPSKDKFSIGLLDTAMTIPAGGTADNTINVESTVPVQAGDVCTVTVTGAGATP